MGEESRVDESQTAATTNEAIVRCRRCNEVPVLISASVMHLVRPRRLTKCKGYKPSLGAFNSPICQTEICSSAEEAIREWNKEYGAVTAV